jgi:hypothetical protein
VRIPLSHIHTFDVKSRFLDHGKVLEFKETIGNLAGFKKEVVSPLLIYHLITLFFLSLHVFIFDLVIFSVSVNWISCLFSN